MTDTLVEELQETQSSLEASNLGNDSTEDEDETVEVGISRKRLTLAEKLKEDEDDKLFNRSLYRFFRSCGLEVDEFRDKTEALLIKVANKSYPVNVKKAQASRDKIVDAFEQLAAIYGDDADKLREFWGKSREEKVAILYGHNI